MQDDVEAGASSVERRRPHAVVEREPTHMHRVDAVLTQRPLEPRVLEPGVALAVCRLTLVDDEVDSGLGKAGVERGARRAPHAVHGPWTALLPEGPVIRWVPVTRGDDEREALRQGGERRDDGVAVGNRQRASGAEIVLHVHDDQSLHGREYSQAMPVSREALREELSRVLLDVEDAMAIEVRGATEAAVLVPLYLEGDDLHAVFTRRREDLRRHAGEISFPGGRYDPGEADLKATALREAHEEIGLPADAVDIVGALQPTPTIATGYAVYPFVGLIEPGRTWTLSAREVAEVIELPFAALRAGYGRRRLIRRGLPIRTDTYLVDDHVIWGATARIMADLFERIEPALSAPAAS